MSETLSAAPSGQAVAGQSKSADGMAFHGWIAGTAVAILVLDVIGCKLTGIHVTGVGTSILGAALVVAIFQALPLYWHRKGRYELRDSSLTVLWTALIWMMLPFPADIAGRLGRAFPLRDPLLVRLDAAMGVNIAALARWASPHWIFHAINQTYVLLAPMLVLAFLIPGLAGKSTAVKRLLVGNLIAFAIGLPVYACMPAVGPWYGEQFAASHAQALCQSDAMRVRDPGPYEHRPAGVICFPSFHVMWAILCAEALACFRWLRWPAWTLAGLIVISTMTTGWHYFTDVLGGIALAGLAMFAARRLVQSGTEQARKSASQLVS